MFILLINDVGVNVFASGSALFLRTKQHLMPMHRSSPLSAYTKHVYAVLTPVSAVLFW